MPRIIKKIVRAVLDLNKAAKEYEDCSSVAGTLDSPHRFREWLEAESRRLGGEHFAGVCGRPGFSPLAFFLYHDLAKRPSGQKDELDIGLTIGFGRIIFIKLLDEGGGEEFATFEAPPWADRYAAWVNAQGEPNEELSFQTAIRGLDVVESMNKAESGQQTREFAQQLHELTPAEIEEKLAILAEAEEARLREALDRVDRSASA